MNRHQVGRTFGLLVQAGMKNIRIIADGIIAVERFLFVNRKAQVIDIK